jgi:hypothetical protein
VSDSDHTLGTGLSDDSARDWFTQHRRGGGRAIDAHVSAIKRAFGPDVSYRFRAPSEPDRGEPWLLVIEIAEPIDDPGAWERLEMAQGALLEERDSLREQMRVKDPFSRIYIAITGAPRRWGRVRQAIREYE